MKIKDRTGEKNLRDKDKGRGDLLGKEGKKRKR